MPVRRKVGTEAMDFGDALTHLRNYKRVSRPDYGFKYIYLV